MIARKRRANKLKKLASQLEQDLETAFYLAEQVNKFSANVEKEYDKEPNIYAAALSLQHYYTSLETAFKRVAKGLDGELPAGEQWHFELLEQMSVKIRDLRPAFLSREEKKKLDKFRRFRHVVRHGYEYELDWSQIEPLVELMNELNPLIEKRFNRFVEFLMELATEIED